MMDNRVVEEKRKERKRQFSCLNREKLPSQR